MATTRQADQSLIDTGSVEATHAGDFLEQFSQEFGNWMKDLEQRLADLREEFPILDKLFPQDGPSQPGDLTPAAPNSMTYSPAPEEEIDPRDDWSIS
ncbi:hypothetical protein GC177_05770 [bacterium]|nr:hypothetical protein [bacterium]